jgi:cytochrome c553
MTCHRSGATSGPIPNIYGVNEKRFVERMKGYRDKSLPNSVMQSVAARLKDDEIESLALFFSKTKKP